MSTDLCAFSGFPFALRSRFFIKAALICAIWVWKHKMTNSWPFIRKHTHDLQMFMLISPPLFVLFYPDLKTMVFQNRWNNDWLAWIEIVASKLMKTAERVSVCPFSCVSFFTSCTHTYPLKILFVWQPGFTAAFHTPAAIQHKVASIDIVKLKNAKLGAGLWQ